VLVLAGGGAAFGVLVWQLGPGAIAGMFERVGWVLLLVTGLYALHIMVRAITLWWCLPPASVTFGEVCRVRFAGEAVEVLTLTGPILAAPATGWMLKGHGLPVAGAYGSAVIEYALYTLTSAWMAGVSLSLLLARRAVPDVLRVPVAGLVLAVAACSAGFAFAAASGKGLVTPAVRALGYRIGPGEAVLLEGAIKLIGVVFFFIPGQIGANEGVYALLFVAVGLPATAGLTTALVRRMRSLVLAGIGVLVALGIGR
jgi:hypothetical protein